MFQVRELRTMSINVPWLEVLKACYPNAQVVMTVNGDHSAMEQEIKWLYFQNVKPDECPLTILMECHDQIDTS